MKVYVKIKHRDHPLPASQRGDAISVYPIVEDQGKETLNSFFLIVVDLKIPCGDKFTIKDNKKQWSCLECEYNNPVSCDIQNITRPVYDKGSLDVAPRVIIKRKFNIDVDAVLSSVESKELVFTTDKTLAEKEEVTIRANEYPQLKTIFIDKEL